jgi:acyl phosphate:glycerol-3-phosphate acyltransferase
MPWLLVAASYFSGSVPFGLFLTRLFARKDVRSEGSGNIGATNVARVAGKKIGALVLILDALKGSIPVLLAQRWFPLEATLHCAVGYLAFLGHVFPLWLRFKGGKGVATALGVLTVLQPIGAALGFASWLLVMALARISSIGSLVGGAVAVTSSFLMSHTKEYAWLSLGLFASMLWTHRENMQRIWTRKEKRL